MEFQTFARRPFRVEAVEITEENIAELAPLIGKLQHRGYGQPSIEVDRSKVPSVGRVTPGYWMTKLNGKIRCYTPKVFAEQFLLVDDEVLTSVEKLGG